MDIIKVEFVSVWSGVEYGSPAELNLNNGVIVSVDSCDRVPDDEGNTVFGESFIRYEDLELSIEENENGRYFIHSEDLGDLQALVSG